jgi:hypothetical protein
MGFYWDLSGILMGNVGFSAFGILGFRWDLGLK